MPPTRRKERIARMSLRDVELEPYMVTWIRYGECCKIIRCKLSAIERRENSNQLIYIDCKPHNLDVNICQPIHMFDIYMINAFYGIPWPLQVPQVLHMSSLEMGNSSHPLFNSSLRVILILLGFFPNNSGIQFSGWWFKPLWKIWKSVGVIIPNIWGKKKMFQTTNQLEYSFFMNSGTANPHWPGFISPRTTQVHSWEPRKNGREENRRLAAFHGKIHGKSMKIHGNPWKINENQWKSMENPWKSSIKCWDDRYPMLLCCSIVSIV